MNSRTCSTSPRAPQSRNFLACSEVIVAASRRCHHGSSRVHSPIPAGFMAKTCLCRSFTKRCHHCFLSPGTKQTYQAAASSVTGDPFSSSSSSMVSIGRFLHCDALAGRTNLSILGCSAAQVSENHLEIPNDQRQVALGWEIVTLAVRQRRGQVMRHCHRHGLVGKPLPDADRDVYLSQVKIPWLC